MKKKGGKKRQHVDALRVNGEFKQSGGSCVLASYAVAASYFTQLPFAAFFEGYCEHFGLACDAEITAEQRYAKHFDTEWRRRNVRGYELILELHKRSPAACFCAARERMTGRFYFHSDTRHLEKKLRKRCAFLNVTYEPGGSGEESAVRGIALTWRVSKEYHSITCFSDGRYLFGRDTNRRHCYLLEGESLASIGRLRDSVLYEKRRK
jgi:hypothetical protein